MAEVRWTHESQDHVAPEDFAASVARWMETMGRAWRHVAEFAFAFERGLDAAAFRKYERDVARARARSRRNVSQRRKHGRRR